MRDIPKIELHLHLEGGAPPAFIRTLAAEKGLDLSEIFNPDGSYAYRDFLHFLSVYEAACTTLTGPEEFYRLTRAVLAESAANGVVYSETFLSPDFCGGGDLGAWREYLAAIRQAADEAEADGITLRGIVTAVRHFGVEQAKITARCAAETADDWLVGFGLAGDEAGFPPGQFAEAFDIAREAGLRLTVHAGEWAGPEPIREALTLGPERLGHGVRAIEDPNLVAELAETGIVLETCPGSNVFLGVFPDLALHPVQRLREAGVKVTVSTDDPPFFHTTMTREYEGLAQTFGWGPTEFAQINETALAAAFCDAPTRARIKTRLETP